MFYIICFVDNSFTYLNFEILNWKYISFTEKEQQEAIEHIDEVQNEIDRWGWILLFTYGFVENNFFFFQE